MIGQTISHYTILEKLGEGGMGVVYKAHDEKLDRVVALKFLPHHLTVNEAEQARFLQEARAAATLNHPNVCTIFDIKEEGGQQFIVMEFVDGKTLRHVVAGSPLGLNDAIAYAIQIGDALQEAHTKGIVHRDVKAENIMVNSKKQIKVMDFGLAKLKGSLKLTKTSSTVGTLAYMAPEQIQGGEVDARSDIFSFGVVLFEMLTGKIPFRGEHDAALMYSIVNEEPEPLQTHIPDAPSELLHIINRCLEKDPEDRYQTVHDMVIDLRRLKKDSSRVSRKTLSHAIPPAVIENTETASIPPTQPVKIQRKRTGIGIGAAVIVVMGIALWMFFRPSARVSDNLVFRPLQIPFPTIWYPGFSADGNWIAFPATDANNVTEIYYMHVSGGEPKALTNDSVFKYTAEISPDGSEVLFSKGNSRGFQVFPLELWTVSTLGGGKKKLAEGSNAARWSPDGKLIAYLGGRLAGGPALWVMNADGSEKHSVIVDSLGGPGSRVSISWSPDGGSIAWIRNFAGVAGKYQEVILHEIETGKERQLTHDKKNIDEVCWTAKGMILFSSNRGGASNLWAIPHDGGDPVQVTRGPGPDPDLGIQASRDGKRVLYLQQSQFGSIGIEDLDGLNARSVTPDDQAARGPRFSPDGKQIAFIVDDQDPIKPNTHLYIVDVDGKNRRQLMSLSTFMINPTWSRDGKRIAYSYRDSIWNAAFLDLNDPSKQTRVGEGIVLGWVDKGSALNVLDQNMSWRIPVDGGKKEILFEDSTSAIPSPDESAILFRDFRIASKGVWISKKGGGKKLLGKGLAGRGAWFPDGKSVILFDNDNAWRVSIDSGKKEPYPWKNSEVLSPADFSPDGKKTLFVKNRTSSKLILIENFQ